MGKVSLRRALGVAAAVWLVAGGASAEGKASLPEGVIAKVRGGEDVREKDFRTYLEVKRVQLSEVPLKGREDLLKNYIIDRKLSLEARERGLDRSAGIAPAIEEFEREQLPRVHFRVEFLGKATVEERDYEPYFTGLADQADIRVAVFDTGQAARHFMDRVGAGSFERMAEQESLGFSSRRGGLIEDVTRGDVRFTLEEKNAIFSSPVGSVAGPFVNIRGVHTVIKVEKRTTVEEGKAAIRESERERIRENKANLAYLTRLNEAMVGSEIEINEEYFDNSVKAGEASRPYLAWVKGQYIYPRDLQIESVKGDHSTRDVRSSLDKRIKAVVARDIALKDGAERDPDYIARREAFLVNVLAAAYLESEFLKGKKAVPDREIEQYYRENYVPELYNVWVVMNEDPSRVAAARRQALAKGNLREIAAKYSTDTSRIAGGQTGPRPLSRFSPEAQKAMKGLKRGEVSEPFLLDGRHAILMILEVRTVEVPALSEVKEQIRSRILLRNRAKMVEEKREETYRKAAPKIDRRQLEAM